MKAIVEVKALAKSRCCSCSCSPLLLLLFPQLLLLLLLLSLLGDLMCCWPFAVADDDDDAGCVWIRVELSLVPRNGMGVSQASV